VEFVGRVTDAELNELYARCRAFVFPGEEDFGIAPLEANASGRPVLAYAAGGALDTVADGHTGVLFGDQRVECLIEAVKRMETLHWDAAALRAHAEKFDRRVFLDQVRQFIDESAAAHAEGARFA
jgi:glycosyltransferase involved in cell wall biosynthesis